MPVYARKYNRGDVYEGPDASFHNILVDMVEEFRRIKDVGFRPQQNSSQIPIVEIRPIKMVNGRGSAILQYNVVGIGNASPSPQLNETQFRDTVTFDTASPSSGGRFAIAIEGASDNGIFSAIISGVVQVKINRTSTSHDYAGSTSGQYDYLTSGSTGLAEILWIDDLPALAIGETVHTGTGAPGGGTGSDGDYYKDTVGEQYYGPKTAGSWGSAHDYGTGICWAIVVLDQSGATASDSFKTIAVSGQSSVVADSSTDTLTLVEGSNITITTNAGTDTITIAADDAPVTSVNGQTGAVTCEVDEVDGTVVVSTTVGASSTTYGLSARVADATHSGIVSTTTQTFSGYKTIQGDDFGAYLTVKSVESGTGYITTVDYRASAIGATIPSPRVPATDVPCYGSIVFGNSQLSISYQDSTTWTDGGDVIIKLLPSDGALGVGDNSQFVLDGSRYDKTGLPDAFAGGDKPRYVVVDSTVYPSVAKYGQWSTVGGMVFSGGLYTSGSLSVAESNIASQAVAPSKLKDADFGDFTVSSGVATIEADAVTNAKLANAAAYSLKGNLTSGSANPTDITLADLPAEAAPASGDYALFMLADGSLAKVDYANLPGAGSGDVTAASNFGTDNRLIRSDGTTKGVQASGITVDDSDNVSGVTTINKVAITAPATGSTLTIADGKTATISNTITITATDGSTLAIGAGGTLGSAAYTAASAYLAVASNLSDLANAGTSRTNLGGTTVGQSYFTLTNPSAITFPRMNADNTVSALSASAFRTAIGAGTGGGDALVANPLSQFAATTSAQLAGVISDETGTGLLVFGTAPTLASTVTIGTAGGTTGAALLKGTTSGTVTLSVADAAGTHTIKLPTADGTNGQALTTNGSGQWGWSTVSGSGNRISAVTETAKSTTFTAVWGEYYPCTGTSYTITLPTAAGNAGKIIAIRSAASGTLTIDGNSSETVDGRTTLALITGDYIELQSDGTNVKIAVFTHADWVSYTPTINAVTTNPTKGATRLELCLYKRDGHDMLIQFLYRQTSAGSAGSGTYLFVLPLSASTDGTYVQTGTATSASTVGSLLGNGQAITVSGGVVGSIGVYAYDSTNLRLAGIYDGSGAGGGQVGSGFFSMSLTDVDYMFTARVPISGW